MAKLASVLNKYNLHTFSPDDIELTDEEYAKAEESCAYIRGLLQKGWHTILDDGVQISIDDAAREYLRNKG